MSLPDVEDSSAAAARRPPGVVPNGLHGGRAGLVTRSAANVVDFLVTLATLVAVYLGVAAVEFMWNPPGFRFPQVSLGLAIVAGSVVAGVYFAVAWLVTGRTYGDYILGLRVVGGTGRRLPPGVAILRAAACVVCPIGLLWVAVSRSNQSLQDLVFRSRVIYDWSDAVPVAGRSLTRHG